MHHWIRHTTITTATALALLAGLTAPATTHPDTRPPTRAATTATPPPDYSDTPTLPTDPGHDATSPAAVIPHTQTTGLDTPATITTRTLHPHTTPVRIPGADLAADGRNQPPDTPSG